MRYGFGLLSVCALGALFLVGCGETVLCEGVVCEDDGNECTTAVCDPATGTCQHTTVEDDTACDFDGLPGLCKAGVCEDAMLCEDVQCEDDGNECTTAVCDPATGTCQHLTVADDTACDFDGSAGLCKAGVCVDAMLCEGVVCDDDNECTDDVCNPLTGTCAYTPVEDGRSCAANRGGCYAGACNFVPVSVALGEKELVFDWSAERCEDLDIPDGPARAVRAEDGEIVLFATHYSGNYLSRGSDFDTLERPCDPPPLVSAYLPTPESYENHEWLWSPYRQGASWHVLIHNEFYDPTSVNCPPGNLCWYNSITYGVSTDGAHSFVKPSPPAHIVAPAPRAWTPPDTPQDLHVEGYMAPTNIVLAPDGYYYALMRLMRIDLANGIDVRGVCAMRTKTLGDPASWRAWDGTGFDLPLPSPYVAGGDVQECEFVELPSGASAQGLTYNTYLERYMSVDEHLSWETGKPVCGFTFSTSFDLIHWSEVQMITPARIGCDTDDTTPGQLEPVRVQYPSIIDHEDSTTNFERPGRTPYLYYTRHHGGLHRDLVRVPLTFTLEE